MDIHFCDLCNESVPQSDIDQGRAHVRRGRVVCANCERAMTHAEGSPAHAGTASGGVALETEIEQAVGILSGDPSLEEPAMSVASGPATPSPLPSPEMIAAPVPSTAEPVPTRSSGLVLAMVALVFAAGAVAVLNEQIGDLGSRARGLEGKVQVQTAALEDLSRSARESRAEAAALRERLGQEIASERDAAGRSIAELRAEAAGFQKTNQELGQRLQDLQVAAAARERDLERVNADLTGQVAKSQEESRALLGRLEKLESDAQRAPPSLPAAGAAGPAPEAPGSRVTALVADLQSPKAATRWEAVDQIGQSGDTEAVPHLLPMLKDTDVFVRMATARVLGDLKATTAVPALIDALEDVEAAVREAALGSLRILTGKDLRFDPMASESERAKKVKAWREWWKKVEEEGGLGKSQG